jgi:hypothetical protein
MDYQEGITIVYADDVFVREAHQKTIELGFSLIITQDVFYEQPQSCRIQWCKEMSELLLSKHKMSAILTNDYYLIRMMESLVPEDKLRLHHLDTGETVQKFVDLKPNPTLENGEYIFRASVQAALKQPNTDEEEA